MPTIYSYDAAITLVTKTPAVTTIMPKVTAPASTLVAKPYA